MLNLLMTATTCCLAGDVLALQFSHEVHCEVQDALRFAFHQANDVAAEKILYARIFQLLHKFVFPLSFEVEIL